MPDYIAIAGNMGSGKSSLVDFLCKKFGHTPFFEPNDLNPYLDDFYKNMEGFAFQSQMFFLVQKFKIHQEMAADKGGAVLVQDRTIFEDAEIFCTNLYRTKKMAKRDYETYMAMYRTILNAIPRPKVLINLHCSVKTLTARIAKRGRASEKAIPVDYIKQLDKLYRTWIQNYNMSPLVTIETEKIDYLEDFIEQERIVHQLKQYLGFSPK